MVHAHPAVVSRVEDLRSDEAAADALVQRAQRRFEAVADRPLRRTVLRTLCHELDDGSLLGMLVRLEERARRGDPGCRALLTELALSPSVLLELPYARVLELHAVARHIGDAALAARFLGAHGASRPAPDANPHLALSAGERTSAARGGERLVLDRLLHDRDPRVIAALLDNPRVTEADVVRITAMRPTLPAILALVAGHPRWGRCYRVRKALAFNPASPPSLARALLPTLLRQHLVELAGSQALSEVLRREVRALLARGEAPEGDPGGG